MQYAEALIFPDSEPHENAPYRAVPGGEEHRIKPERGKRRRWHFTPHFPKQAQDGGA